jgi:hypothetical protein
MAELDRDWTWSDMQDAHVLIDTVEEHLAKEEFHRNKPGAR